MNEKNSEKKVKGSVLYTVISVMMVMTVLVFAALTLAASAHRRAANSYANNQTQYTARSVIDTICEAMQSNPEFSSQFASLEIEGQAIEVAVELPGGDTSMGTIVGNPTITLLGTGTEYGYNSSKNMYKISATVKMSGQENTVAGYFLAEKVDNSMPFNYALVALEGADNFNNIGVMGGVSAGSNQNFNFSAHNADAVIQSPININGNLNVAAGAEIILSKTGEGVFVSDNITFENAGQTVKSDIKYDLDHKVNYRDLPYVYVGGSINYYDSDYMLGSETNPVIIFADSIQCKNLSNNYPIWGDVYLFGVKSASNIYHNFNPETGILPWDSDILKKEDNAINSSYKGGNLYSMGTINAGSNSPKIISNLANNVVAETINFNASAKTSGAVVSKNVVINGNPSFSENKSYSYEFEDGLYVDLERFSINGDFIVNEYKYTQPVIGSRDVEIYDGYTENYYTNINEETGQPYIHGQNQVLQWDNYLDVYYDLSSIIPADADTFTVEPIVEVDVSPIDGIEYYESPYVVCQFRKYNGLNEHGDEVYAGQYGHSCEFREYVNFNTISTLSGGQFKDHTKGKLAINFTAWNSDYNKPILINSISVKFKITAYKTEYFIASQIDNREYLRTVNDYAFDKNGNVIYIDDIDKSVKLEKSEDGFGGYELKISKADLTVIEEGEETNPSEVTYEEIGIYDYDDLDSYADFLRAVVDTVTFPDSMKKVEKPDTKPTVYAPEIVDASFLEWTSYEDVSKNFVAVSKQEYEAKKQVDKAFQNINLTENLVYTFNYSKVSWVDGAGQVIEKDLSEDTEFEISSSCTFTGALSNILKIKPSAENIYIKLDNFTLTSQNASVGTTPAIIINDSGGEKRVNFLIPAGGTFSIMNSHIMTQTYYNMYINGSFDIFQNPSKQEFIPGIYFFLEYDNENPVTISASNNVMITGYIMAPTATCSLSEPYGIGYNYTTNELYLDKDAENGIASKTLSEVSDRSGIAVIGGIIAKNAQLNPNNSGCLYVNPNSLLEVKNQKEMTLGDYRCLYYQAY